MNIKKQTKDLVIISLFCAIVFLLAFTPFIGYIPLGITKATTVHIPVILSSLLLGPKKGMIIGFCFGLTSFINNTFVNPTAISFVFTPFFSNAFGDGNFLSLIICFVPRMLVGILPYYANKILNQTTKNQTISIGISAVIGSLTNTILVMSMIYLFFGNQYAAAKEVSANALLGVIMTIVGTNGVPEAIAASILVTVIYKAFTPKK